MLLFHDMNGWSYFLETDMSRTPLELLNFLFPFFLCKFLNRLHFVCVEFHYFLNVLATCFILFKQVLSQSRKSCLICLVIWIQKFWLTFPEGFVIIFFSVKYELVTLESQSHVLTTRLYKLSFLKILFDQNLFWPQMCL